MQTTDEDIQEKQWHFGKFHGRTSSYYRIWIVNTLLTIATLGIYSAWAKVRTLKFFYGTTELNGARFDFHGDPLSILKGRLIAIVLLGLYLYGSKIHPLVGMMGTLAVFCLMPWIFVKSQKFKLGNTSYRNIRFSFRGSMKEAYGIWFKYATFPLLISLAGIGVSFMSTEDQTIAAFGTLNNRDILSIGLLLINGVYFLFASSFFFSSVINYMFNNVYFGKSKAGIQSSPKEVAKEVVFPSAACFILAFAFYFLLLSTVSMGLHIMVLIVLSAFVPGFLAFVGIIRLSYGMMNFAWHRIKLNGHKIQTNLKFSQYFIIEITNLISIILSLGLAYPWAVVRKKSYIVNNRGIELAGFEQFTSDLEHQESAIGEEVSETYDLGFEVGL